MIRMIVSVAIAFSIVQLNGMEYFKQYFFPVTQQDIFNTIDSNWNNHLLAVCAGFVQITEPEIMYQLLIRANGRQKMALIKAIGREKVFTVFKANLLKQTTTVTYAREENLLFYCLDAGPGLFTIFLALGIDNYSRTDELGNTLCLLDEILKKDIGMGAGSLLSAFLFHHPRITKENYPSKYSPLFNACDSLISFKLLMKTGLSLDVRGPNRNTLLHEAARQWNIALVEFLIKEGVADLRSINAFGETACDVFKVSRDTGKEVGYGRYKQILRCSSPSSNEMLELLTPRDIQKLLPVKPIVSLDKL